MADPDGRVVESGMADAPRRPREGLRVGRHGGLQQPRLPRACRMSGVQRGDRQRRGSGHLPRGHADRIPSAPRDLVRLPVPPRHQGLRRLRRAVVRAPARRGARLRGTPRRLPQRRQARCRRDGTMVRLRGGSARDERERGDAEHRARGGGLRLHDRHAARRQHAGADPRRRERVSRGAGSGEPPPRSGRCPRRRPAAGRGPVARHPRVGMGRAVEGVLRALP